MKTFKSGGVHPEENKISEKMVIVEKEVYENQENASELTAVAQQCGIKSNEIGVYTINF